MVATEKKTPSRAGQPLLPPDERLWKRYSPHYELPLAAASSFFIHGLVVGILAVGGLAFLFRASVEASRPPQMGVAFVEDSAGFGGTGGAPGPMGEQGLEQMGIGGVGGHERDADTGKEGVDDLPDLPDSALDFSRFEAGIEPSNNLVDQFKQLNIDAEKRAKDPSPKAAGKGGILGPKGLGTGMGKIGSGKGSGEGGGGGGGKPGGVGRKATEQEIKAWRWRFDMTGSPQEHANKLDRAGLMVAVPDPAAGKADPKKGQHLFIRDLKRRPVKLEQGDFAKYEDAVKWYNSKTESVRGLVGELKLPFVPEYVVLLLPKDREAKMAGEEKRFAQKNGRNPATVQETWFDFRLQNGVYEPVVISQK
jgi:hypothetical protein